MIVRYKYQTFCYLPYSKQCSFYFFNSFCIVFFKSFISFLNCSFWALFQIFLHSILEMLHSVTFQHLPFLLGANVWFSFWKRINLKNSRYSDKVRDHYPLAKFGHFVQAQTGLDDLLPVLLNVECLIDQQKYFEDKIGTHSINTL